MLWHCTIDSNHRKLFFRWPQTHNEQRTKTGKLLYFLRFIYTINVLNVFNIKCWITWIESIKGVDCEKEKKIILIYCQQQWALPIVWTRHCMAYCAPCMFIALKHIFFFSFLFNFQSMKRFHEKTFYSKQSGRFVRPLTVPSKSLISFQKKKNDNTIIWN